jgi:aryl-alcohol dehydrogenase-like predicted oxidoreductase
MGPGPNDAGLSRRHLRNGLDASLRRLGVEAVDLYQLHAFDPHTPLDETLHFLSDAIHAGKIAYVGLSNYTGWQIQKIVDLAEFRALVRPVTLQPQYNLLVREIEWEIVPACRSTGLGLLPWSPLGGAWLTGKYTRKARPTGATRLGENPDRGVEAYDRRSTQQRTWDVIDAVDSIAGARGVTMAQVALAWLLGRPMVSSVILGARTVEQLRENLCAADLLLTGEEAGRLDAVSDPAPADYLRWPGRGAAQPAVGGQLRLTPSLERAGSARRARAGSGLRRPRHTRFGRPGNAPALNAAILDYLKRHQATSGPA